MDPIISKEGAVGVLPALRGLVVLSPEQAGFFWGFNEGLDTCLGACSRSQWNMIGVLIASCRDNSNTQFDGIEVALRRRYLYILKIHHPISP